MFAVNIMNLREGRPPRPPRRPNLGERLRRDFFRRRDTLVPQLSRIFLDAVRAVNGQGCLFSWTYPYIRFNLFLFALFMLSVNSSPAKGRWLGLPRRRGFHCHFYRADQKRLGSAENPSVSLRDPPSLGKGRSNLPLTSQPSGLCIRIFSWRGNARRSRRSSTLPKINSPLF
jgi:hypothetical protein